MWSVVWDGLGWGEMGWKWVEVGGVGWGGMTWDDVGCRVWVAGRALCCLALGRRAFTSSFREVGWMGLGGLALGGMGLGDGAGRRVAWWQVKWHCDTPLL